MPRIAEGRPPAEPSSGPQQARYRSILRAAAARGTESGYDGMQMTDVAKDAGVAIATLYRYFPSKTVLFTSLLRSQVDRLDHEAVARRPGQEPWEAVAVTLMHAGRRLLERPLLAQAMLQSNNASVTTPGSSHGVTRAFADVLLRLADVEHPSPRDHQLVRLIEQTWYGVLISWINRHIDAEQADQDTTLACRLLLADLGKPVPASARLTSVSD